MSRRPPPRPDRSSRAESPAARAERRAAERRARQRRAVVVFAVPVLAFVALAIVHQRSTRSPSAGAAATASTVPLSVGVTRCTFVDHSRSTEGYDRAGATGHSTPERVLATEIRYPTIHPSKGETETTRAAPARVRGPFPLIVFASGYNLDPDTYARLLDTWVRAGFVVAAPLFPDTNHEFVTALGGIQSPEDDIVNQPGDVAFVARSMLAATKSLDRSCAIADKLVDARAGIGLAGQSDGAETIGMLAYDTTQRTHLAGLRLRAVALLSGQPYGDDHYGPAPGAPRTLVVQSATDRCNLASESTQLYNDIPDGDKAFLEIADATHLGPYTGSATAPFALVARVTRALFETSLTKALSSSGYLAIGRSAPGVGSLTVNGTAPVMPSLSEDVATCYLD